MLILDEAVPSLLRQSSQPFHSSVRLGLLGPLDPPVPDGSDLLDFEPWFERACFVLMAATFDRCVSGTNTAPVSALAETILCELTNGLASHDSVEADFLGAKALFTVLASCDLAGIAVPAPAAAAAVARFTGLAPDTGDVLKLSSRNNHVLMKALPLGLFAALCGDEAAWRTARSTYERYLGGIDADGIPKAEAVRGASAAWYCNLAVMLLVRFQAIATQYEGASPRQEKDKVAALVAALGEIATDPSILHQWSRRNMYPHPNHGTDPFKINTDFLRSYHRSRHYLAWVPLFEAIHGPDRIPSVIQVAAHNRSDYFPKGTEFIGGFVDLMV